MKLHQHLVDIFGERHGHIEGSMTRLSAIMFEVIKIILVTSTDSLNFTHYILCVKEILISFSFQMYLLIT